MKLAEFSVLGARGFYFFDNVSFRLVPETSGDSGTVQH
jgi:hypothetical protein